MKNHIDMLIFHTHICAGASQICLMAGANLRFAPPRRVKRSGMEIKMNYDLLKSMGLGNLDISYLFLGILILLIILLILFIVQTVKLSILTKKYKKFMSGKNAKNLEKDIIGLYEDNKFIKASTEKNKKDIQILYKKFEGAFQKAGIVKYDAFNQMGGKLSFCLALLDEKDNGFLLNSVHSTEGCYSYIKEIKGGSCDILLGNEEKKALDMALEKSNN